jgi:hypothetical protein
MITNGLTHYWPINNDLTDYITGANLTAWNSSLLGWSTDRLNRPTSSLDLNGGYYTLPAAYYFTGDFTISAWMLAKNYSFGARILDCGKGSYSDSVLLAYSRQRTGKPFTNVYNGTSGNSTIISNHTLTLNTWIHLATTLSGFNMSIYINGVSDEWWYLSYAPRNTTRPNCYIGNSDFSQVEPSFARFDEIKIYNRALSANEIWTDYNSY